MRHNPRPALELLRQELRAAGAPSAGYPEYMLSGSTVMHLLSLRDSVGDIDVFVSARLYLRLVMRGWKVRVPDLDDPPMLEWYAGECRVNAWEKWTQSDGLGIDIPRMLYGAQIINGWPCVPPQELLRWKTCGVHRHHEKHRRDVAALEAYLGSR